MNKRVDKRIILKIYQLPQTVFTLKELSLLFPSLTQQALKNKMHYAVRTGSLHALRRGVYAKEKFNPLELATKLYTPSYVSLETVLVRAGMVFQAYRRIFVVSYLTRIVRVGDHEIMYRKIKDTIMINPSGVEEKDGIAIATTERAFLDALYLYRDYHFDNLNPLNWEKVEELQSIYRSGALTKRLREYRKLYDEART